MINHNCQELGVLETLTNVHNPCTGMACVIHNPTDHHMRSWTLIWRQDRGIFERLCTCGIGHPDPDQYPYWRSAGREYEAVHGCCGHCIAASEVQETP